MARTEEVTRSVSSVGAEESLAVVWTEGEGSRVVTGAARIDKGWDTVSWRSSDRACGV